MPTSPDCTDWYLPRVMVEMLLTHKCLPGPGKEGTWLWERTSHIGDPTCRH